MKSLKERQYEKEMFPLLLLATLNMALEVCSMYMEAFLENSFTN